MILMMQIIFTQFDCNDNMILWNDQDNDIYYFYDINKKEIVDSFKLSSAYSQLFINEEGKNF